MDVETREIVYSSVELDSVTATSMILPYVSERQSEVSEIPVTTHIVTSVQPLRLKIVPAIQDNEKTLSHQILNRTQQSLSESCLVGQLNYRSNGICRSLEPIECSVIVH